MARRPSFADEIGHLLYAQEVNPIHACIQCGTCSGTCPADPFMDHTPRDLIQMIRAGQRDRVLGSNAHWSCASCYECSMKCPRGIDIAYMMYGLKRYSIWRGRWRRGMVGPDFSRRFVRVIAKNGRSFEPALAVPYLHPLGRRRVVDYAPTP